MVKNNKFISMKEQQQPNQIDHREKIKELLFQVLDELTKAKGEGQLSGTIQLNFHKRIGDIIRTMWKDRSVNLALVEAKKAYKASAPGQGSPGLNTMTSGGKKLTVLQLTPLGCLIHRILLAKKKRLVIDPGAAPDQVVHEKNLWDVTRSGAVISDQKPLQRIPDPYG